MAARSSRAGTAAPAPAPAPVHAPAPAAAAALSASAVRASTVGDEFAAVAQEKAARKKKVNETYTFKSVISLFCV